MEKTRFFACFVRMFNAMCFAICAVLFSLDAYSNCATGYHEQTSPFNTNDYLAPVSGIAYHDVNESIAGYAIPIGRWSASFNYDDNANNKNIHMHGVLHGQTFCASTGTDHFSRTQSSFQTSSNIEQSQPGKYCWCRIDGFTPTGGQLISVTGKWVALGKMYNQNSCENNLCAYKCSDVIYLNVNLRKALYGSLPACAPDTLVTYYITYDNMANATWGDEQNHPTSYNAGDTIELGVPTREGYTFVAWCDDENLQVNCSSTKTISSSDTGDKTFYAKWDTLPCEAGRQNQTSPFTENDYKAPGIAWAYYNITNGNPTLTTYRDANIVLDNTLEDLPVGRYEIFFSSDIENFHGMLYGKAKCSATTGYTGDWTTAGHGQSVPNNISDVSGNYCWCQLDGYVPYTKSGSQWVPNGDRVDFLTKWLSPGGETCTPSFCTEYCVEKLRAQSSDRQVLYGPDTVPSCAIKTYTITYELDNGEWPIALTGKPETYTIASSTITLPIPTREGYTFEGWLDNQGNSVSTIPTGSYGNKVFHASWQDNSPQPAEPLSCQTGYVNQEISDCDLSGLDINLPMTDNTSISHRKRFKAQNGSTCEQCSEDYDGLNNGEFEVAFDYGRVKGRSVCSAHVGNSNNSTYTNDQSLWLSNDEDVLNTEGEKKYCWAQMTGFTSNGLQCTNVDSVWVFMGVSPNESSCLSLCAGTATLQVARADNSSMGYSYKNVRKALYDSATGTTQQICEPINYTITYTNDDNESVTLNYTVADTVDLPTLSDIENATFAGWCINSIECDTGVSQIPAGTTGNITLHAKWNAVEPTPTQTYTVTFDLGDNGTNQATYNVGETITLPEQTKDDYAFVGYCVNSSNCSADLRVKQLNYAEIPENPITLYPQFIKVATVQEPEKCLNYNGCSVIIDLGNGDEIEQTFSEDTDLVLPAQESTSNTVFNGYCENSATCVDPVMNLTYEQATGNSVFYPQYIATSAEEIPTIEDRTCASETCSVIVNIPVVAPTRGMRGLRLFRSASANTYNETTVKTFNEGDLMVLPLPTKTDSTLSGYCIGEEDSCGNPVMTITNDDLDVNENSVTITPVFTEKTIISCPEDYPELDENDQCYNSWTCPETPICPTHSNTCIYTGATSGRDYYGQPSSALCEISFTCDLGYENTTNSAVCTPIEYDIQYVIPDGDFLSTLNNDSIPRKYTVESIIDLSGIEATRPGYSFEGWYDNENLNGSASTTLSNLQPGGITLYAKFEPIVCTVVYHDGDAETQETYTAQATIDLTQLSAKVRYTFEGWCEDLDNCPEPKNTLTASNGTINLYANGQE